VSEVSLACFISCCLGGSFDRSPNATSGEIDKRFTRSDVLSVSKLLEAVLDIIGEV
jgi:hypothetical protein